MDATTIRSKAVTLIGTYLGDVVATSYKDFYADKDASVVKVSVHELLTDYLGGEKAKEILKKHGIN